MKRVDLIRHIEANGCAFLREGGRHTVYFNPTSRKVATISWQRKSVANWRSPSPESKRSRIRENKAMQRTRIKIGRCGSRKAASR